MSIIGFTDRPFQGIAARTTETSGVIILAGGAWRLASPGCARFSAIRVEQEEEAAISLGALGGGQALPAPCGTGHA